jgi:hypothetical protein
MTACERGHRSGRPPAIAFFISPHGFGHAARAAALIQRLHELRTDLRFVAVTTIPQWFLRDSVSTPLEFVPEVVDVGLVQRSAVTEDLPATVRKLDALYPPRPDRVAALAATLKAQGCAAVVADIAPLGLSVARAAGIPGILVENFTWDWIYAAYERLEPGLARHRKTIAGLLADADLHIQTAPVCDPQGGALQVGPICRRPRLGRAAARASLAVGDRERLVLVSMGGVPARFDFAWRLEGRSERFLLIGETPGDWPRNVLTLPSRSGHYHPDLVMAADVVVGKLGYSTVGEASRSGVDWIWVDRPAFPETAILAAYVESRHRCRRITAETLESGDWIGELDALAGSRPSAGFVSGSTPAAAAILRLL